MALANDDSPFVKFIGTSDKEDKDADRNGIEMDPVIPPEPPCDEGGDGGVPYLIQRTLQDRQSESLSFANIHKVSGDYYVITGLAGSVLDLEDT